MKKKCIMQCGKEILTSEGERPICKECKEKIEGKNFVSMAQARRFIYLKDKKI